MSLLPLIRFAEDESSIRVCCLLEQERVCLRLRACASACGRIASRWDFPLHEQNRMMHVVLGFMALLSHKKVATKKIGSHAERSDVIRIELPRAYNVDRIVDASSLGSGLDTVPMIGSRLVEVHGH